MKTMKKLLSLLLALAMVLSLFSAVAVFAADDEEITDVSETVTGEDAPPAPPEGEEPPAPPAEGEEPAEAPAEDEEPADVEEPSEDEVVDVDDGVEDVTGDEGEEASGNEVMRYILGSNQSIENDKPGNGVPTVTIDGVVVSVEDNGGSYVIPASVLESLTVGTHELFVTVDASAATAVYDLMIIAATYAVGVDADGNIVTAPYEEGLGYAFNWLTTSASRGYLVTNAEYSSYNLYYSAMSDGLLTTTTDSKSNWKLDGTSLSYTGAGTAYVGNLTDTGVAFGADSADVTVIDATTGETVTSFEDGGSYYILVTMEIVVPDILSDGNTVTIAITNGDTTSYVIVSEGAVIASASTAATDADAAWYVNNTALNVGEVYLGVADGKLVASDTAVEGFAYDADNGVLYVTIDEVNYYISGVAEDGSVAVSDNAERSPSTATAPPPAAPAPPSPTRRPTLLPPATSASWLTATPSALTWAPSRSRPPSSARTAAP